MIDRDTVVVGVQPRIDRDTFCRILRDAQSPASEECAAAYDAVVAQGVDPLFALAIFWHESQFGRVGICHDEDTKNPGNTRTSRTGVGVVITTPRGQFVKYPSWAEGFRDLAARLTDPAFVYAQEGRTTIARIIERWAPRADGNDPEGYVAAVVRFMQQHEGRTTMAEVWYPKAIRYQSPYMNRGSDYNRAWPTSVTHVVMHHTAGSWDSVVNEFTSGSRHVSAHFLVGRDGRVAQFVSLDDIAWHAGDWGMNVKSVGIEHEQYVRSDGTWTTWTDAQLSASAQLLSWLFAQAGKPLTVLRHRDVVSTDCPGDLPVEKIVAMATQATGNQEPPEGGYTDLGNARVYRVGGKLITLGGGFLSYYRWLEALLGPSETLLLIGLPITDEQKEDNLTVQYFERAVFEWHPGKRPERWDVLLRRVGYEAARAKGYVK